MREIKFRAWDMNDNSWANYSEESARYKRGIAEFFESKQPFYRFNRGDIVLMQFTGIKDKNGKEIYEGDILKPLSPLKGKPHEVKWESAAFVIGASFVLGLPPFQSNNFEVIGNIYESPDLLEQTNE